MPEKQYPSPTWSPAVVLFLVGQLVTAAGVYAAIRADLATAIVEAHEAKTSAGRAHERIDRLQEGRR